MSDAPHRTSYDAALDAVRGYAHSDAVTVREALTGLDARAWTEVYAAWGSSGLLDVLEEFRATADALVHDPPTVA
ncbi:hypothetical protein CTU88_10685 [Streptomyces sp. JV178]|uniref:hypothetical protein n=1 Tax=Streptomyces sp. JV178 TaxID=858632 RepID=UPI000C1B319F|nr:hypothetical protein [Streptomyces sp. JV178]PIM72600.1 hypothetical protein CTU88_10685 [Streptomyces sp. JV178]